VPKTSTVKPNASRKNLKQTDFLFVCLNIWKQKHKLYQVSPKLLFVVFSSQGKGGVVRTDHQPDLYFNQVLNLFYNNYKFKFYENR